MTERISLSKRLLAGVGAFALAAAGLTGVGVANAAPGPGQDKAPDHGSLIVHKRIGQEGAAGNGTVLDPAPGTALADVEFTVQRVGRWTEGTCVAINLATDAGWAAAQAAVGANPGAPVSPASEGKLCASGQSTAQSTNASGETTFGNLSLGLYYVTETDAPSNVIDRALPFYVTIPFPSASGTGNNVTTDWLYDVNVYPKNATADKPTKTIGTEQTDLVLDADVTWTIAQKIPTLSGTTSAFTEASISDQLDPRLAYKGGVPLIENVNGSQLGDSDDYDFTNVNGLLTWKFTPSGLGKLKANQGKTLSVALVTTVTSVTANSTTPGKITNKGTVSFNNKPQDTETNPYTYWGDLTVTKQDKDSKAKLAGAEFKVFAKAAAATCAPTMPATGEIATGKSNSTGVVLWDSATTAESPLGLFIANSNTVIPNPTRDYCLYESAAPVGYTAITTPWTVTITTDKAASVALTVDNTKRQGPALPLTGAMGTAVFGGSGLALLVLAAVAGVTIRRRQNAN